LFHLWPITRAQFEMFMCEENLYGDDWYDVVLRLAPRVSCMRLRGDNYEGGFMTGILPDEALAFARWLGGDFDLPTDQEWLALYAATQKQRTLQPPRGLSVQAQSIWQRLATFQTTPLQFALLEDGLLDCVRDGDSYAGRGAPRGSFQENVWNPLHNRPVRPLNVTTSRVRYLGFRLVKR
jgi:formylglycine-generating enzyme required for sulfatase activity